MSRLPGRWYSPQRTYFPDAAPRGGPFSGATVEWSYPENLHDRALTRVSVIRHAIAALPEELEGSTIVDVQ